MRFKAFALACAFTLTVAGGPAMADEPSGAAGKRKPTAEELAQLKDFFNINPGSMPEASKAAPKAVTRVGCVLFPGHTPTFSFFAGWPFLNRLVVQPTTFFDVGMRVRLQGVFTRTRDQFFAPFAERLNFFSPTPFRRVTVTIFGALPGPLTGCWRFTARP